MIKLFRISDPEFAKTPEDMLSGQGSFLFGGRWNSPGYRVVYLAESLSLAAYELLVHVPDQVVAPFRRISISVPEDLILTLDESALPEDWQNPGHPDLAAIGDSWIESNSSLALSLPSALVPGEKNVILRPDHPDFKSV
jgi:RES domain-containing protein